MDGGLEERVHLVVAFGFLMVRMVRRYGWFTRGGGVNNGVFWVREQAEDRR